MEIGHIANGLTDSTRLLYRRAVEHGPATRDELVALAVPDLPADEARQCIDTLLAMTLLDEEKKGLLSPANPDAVSTGYLSSVQYTLGEEEETLLRHKHELGRMRNWTSSLGSVYYQPLIDASENRPIFALHDVRRVRLLLDKSLREAQVSVATCQAGGLGPERDLADTLLRDRAALARGVKLRSLYQESAQFDWPTVAYAREVVPLGSEIRMAAVLPPRMITVDDTVAFLMDRSDSESAVVVHEPSVIAFLQSIFDTMWSTATPFLTAQRATAELSQADSCLIRLLADGLTHKAIGNRMGLAERTVGKRVARLFEELSAKSHFQAGVIAQSRELIAAIDGN